MLYEFVVNRYIKSVILKKLFIVIVSSVKQASCMFRHFQDIITVVGFIMNIFLGTKCLTKIIHFSSKHTI